MLLKRLFEEQRDLFTAEPTAADKLLQVGETRTRGRARTQPNSPRAPCSASALLNHDEA